MPQCCLQAGPCFPGRPGISASRAHFFPVVSGIFRISGNQVAFICIALYGTSHGIRYFMVILENAGTRLHWFTRKSCPFHHIQASSGNLLLPAAVLRCCTWYQSCSTCLRRRPACQLHRWSCQAVLRHNSVFASFYRKSDISAHAQFPLNQNAMSPSARETALLL